MIQSSMFLRFFFFLEWDLSDCVLLSVAVFIFQAAELARLGSYQDALALVSVGFLSIFIGIVTATICTAVLFRYLARKRPDHLRVNFDSPEYQEAASRDIDDTRKLGNLAFILTVAVSGKLTTLLLGLPTIIDQAFWIHSLAYLAVISISAIVHLLLGGIEITFREPRTWTVLDASECGLKNGSESDSSTEP